MEDKKPTEPVAPLSVVITKPPSRWEEMKKTLSIQLAPALRDAVVILTCIFHVTLLGSAFKGLPFVASAMMATSVTICFGLMLIGLGGYFGED